MKYESLAFLQFDFDTNELENFLEQGNEEAILTIAGSYDFGQDGDKRDVPVVYKGDYVVAENKNFTVVRNSRLGTWDILRNINED